MSKWPKKIKFRNKVLAKIYRPCRGRASYRVTWYVAGKRQMKSFPTYGGQDGAREYAETKVKDLANNSQAAFLTPAQATDSLAAIERLNSFHHTTGRKVSILAAVSEYCEAAARLQGQTLTEAVEGFSRTVATVKRQDLTKAVEQFIATEEPRTREKDGKRAQLSAKYHYNKAIQLRRFACTFTGYAVCDVAKHDLDNFFTSKLLSEFTPKSRNHHRTALKQFLAWSLRKDYLPTNHRLMEADSLRPERNDSSETEFYTPKEFRALLDSADENIRPLIAVGGLAGLRTEEMFRLDWADIWRCDGHIEISKGKAKTRTRRLVEIYPALAVWMGTYRAIASGKFWEGAESTFQEHFAELCEQVKIKRKANGLRHSFCTYHFALHGNENLTAQQAGNSPAMIHAHYKGLATKKEAQAWFAIKPAKAAKNIIPMAKGTA